MSLGQGVVIAATKFDSVMSQQKNSLFVKNLAVAIFGTECLRQSSVTGKSSNRYKGRAACEPLDKQKMLALSGNHHSNFSNAIHKSCIIILLLKEKNLLFCHHAMTRIR